MPVYNTTPVVRGLGAGVQPGTPGMPNTTGGESLQPAPAPATPQRTMDLPSTPMGTSIPPGQPNWDLAGHPNWNIVARSLMQRYR